MKLREAHLRRIILDVLREAQDDSRYQLEKSVDGKGAVGPKDVCMISDEGLASLNITFFGKPVIRAIRMTGTAGNRPVALLMSSDGVIGKGRPIPSEQIKTGSSLYVGLKKFLNSEEAVTRHLEIAKLKSDQDLKNSLTYNSSGRFFVMVDCDDPNLLARDKDADKDIGLPDYSMITDEAAKIIADSEDPLGKTAAVIASGINSLPPKEQEEYVKWLNGASIALGIGSVFQPSIGLIDLPVTALLAAYYKTKGDNFNAVLSFVSAGLTTFALGLSFKNLEKSVEWIRKFLSDYDKNVKSGFWARMGFKQKGSTLGSIKDFIEFIESNFYYTHYHRSDLVKVGPNAWHWMDDAGNPLKTKSGEIVEFTDDARDFIIKLIFDNPNFISQYLNWYNGMPGKLNAFMIGGAAVLDTITLGSLIASLGGEAESPTPVAASNQIGGSNINRLFSPYFTAASRLNPPAGQVIIYNLANQTNKTVSRESLGSLENSGLKISRLRVLIVDNEIFDTLDTLLKFPKSSLGPQNLILASQVGDIKDIPSSQKVIVTRSYDPNGPQPIWALVTAGTITDLSSKNQ